jgi:hypothetical protein
MDTEERKLYPMTRDQAILPCRTKIEGLVFSAAPAKKLKTRGIVDVMELMHFPYVYNRKLVTRGIVDVMELMHFHYVYNRKHVY